MYRKCGLSLVRNTYGVPYLIKHRNQAGALLHIYKDGSALLTY